MILDGYYNGNTFNSKSNIKYFENIFAKNIVNKMLFGWTDKNDIYFIVLLTVAFGFSGKRSIILIVFQLIFPVII